jgi:hypothetical protein
MKVQTKAPHTPTEVHHPLIKHIPSGRIGESLGEDKFWTRGPIGILWSGLDSPSKTLLNGLGNFKKYLREKFLAFLKHKLSPSQRGLPAVDNGESLKGVQSIRKAPFEFI